ncbi:MAG TPA: molecular chaperone GrpE [Bacillus bacterium]|nr:molecular chaperone GrpE [Bacillus sp. (in: firmicutes)]
MEYIFQKRAKLVGNIESGVLSLLNMHDDWIHDQYGESFIHHGEIHSGNTAFHPFSTNITGYFQDDETSKWIKVKNGIAPFNPEEPESAWKGRIESYFIYTIKTGCHTRWKKIQINS